MRRLVEDINTMDPSGKYVIEVNGKDWPLERRAFSIEIELIGSHQDAFVWTVQPNGGTAYSIGLLRTLGCKVYEVVPREWAEFKIDGDPALFRVNRRLDIEVFDGLRWDTWRLNVHAVGFNALEAARELIREDA